MVLPQLGQGKITWRPIALEVSYPAWLRNFLIPAREKPSLCAIMLQDQYLSEKSSTVSVFWSVVRCFTWNLLVVFYIEYYKVNIVSSEIDIGGKEST
jgi:hypothetical protein